MFSFLLIVLQSNIKRNKIHKEVQISTRCSNGNPVIKLKLALLKIISNQMKYNII
jgi:hypothetical protein